MQNKLQVISLNAVWQLMPMLSSLILSLVVVRLWEVGVWAEVVRLFVIQQVVIAASSWGNKDYLQREWSRKPSDFSNVFQAHVFNRLIILISALLIVWVADLCSEYFWILVIMCLGRFMQESFDVINLIYKKQNVAVIIESVVLLSQLCMLWWVSQLPLDISVTMSVLLIIGFGFLVKGIATRLYFLKHLSRLSIKLSLLKDSIHFALINFTGMLGSRIDLIIATFLLTDASLGMYQIFMAFLWNLQAGARHILNPYMHHFYRLVDTKKATLHLKLIVGGLVISIVGSGLTVAILKYVFELEIDWIFVLPAFLFAIQSYIYLPWIAQMIQRDKQQWIFYQNLGGLLVFSILIFMLQLKVSIDLTILIWFVTANQIAMTILRYIYFKRLSNVG